MGMRSSMNKIRIPLSLLALFIASLACSLPSERLAESIASTQTALEVQATTLALEQARLTQDAELQADSPHPTVTVTAQAEIENTATPTDDDTGDSEEGAAGSLERAAFDPAFGWGAPQDGDDFDGGSGKFPTNSAGAANAWYEDGRYRITFTSRGLWTWYWSFIDAEDFYVDFLIFNGEQCVPGDTAGIVFRGDKAADRGLMFGISCGGEYFVGKTYWPPTDSPVCSWLGGALIDCDRRALTGSELIQSGAGAINRIGVMVKGTDVDFYINGKWVDNRSIPAGWYESVHGQFALYLGSAQKPDAGVSFDDFSVWYLDE